MQWAWHTQRGWTHTGSSGLVIKSKQSKKSWRTNDENYSKCEWATCSLAISSFHWDWYFWKDKTKRVCKWRGKSGGKSFKRWSAVKLSCTHFRMSERRHARTYHSLNHSIIQSHITWGVGIWETYGVEVGEWLKIQERLQVGLVAETSSPCFPQNGKQLLDCFLWFNGW